MGLDIWFKDDLANILAALDEGNLAVLESVEAGLERDGYPAGELRQAYRSGFVAALETVARALGLRTAEAAPGVASRAWRVQGQRPQPTLALPVRVVGEQRWEK